MHLIGMINTHVHDARCHACELNVQTIMLLVWLFQNTACLPYYSHIDKKSLRPDPYTRKIVQLSSINIPQAVYADIVTLNE